MRRILVGGAIGLAISLVVLWLLGLARGHGVARTRLVAEDASAPLRRIAIHYAPAADLAAVPVWTQLFGVLPETVEVEVEVAAAQDFDRFLGKMSAAGVGRAGRFHPVVVGTPITTGDRSSPRRAGSRLSSAAPAMRARRMRSRRRCTIATRAWPISCSRA